MASIENDALRQKLTDIIKKQPNTIASHVAQEAISHDDISKFFDTLEEYGCQSGVVGSLTKYSDCHAFYDLHKPELEQLLKEFKQENGEDFIITDDRKTQLAWFGFEREAKKIR